MTKYLKIIIVFVLFLNSIDMTAQQKEKQIELHLLNIEEKNFLSILDSIILHEKKCDYFDGELLFDVLIKKFENNYYLISIWSQTDINISLSFDLYGYFYYQNYLFVVQGEQCEDIFSICDTKRLFKYIDYNHSDFQPKKGEKVMIYIYNDDSFSQWHYWYINGKFILEDKHTSCK